MLWSFITHTGAGTSPSAKAQQQDREVGEEDKTTHGRSARAKAKVKVKAGKARADGRAASKKLNKGRPFEGVYLKLTAGMAKFAECDEVTGAAWCAQHLRSSTNRNWSPWMQALQN